MVIASYANANDDVAVIFDLSGSMSDTAKAPQQAADGRSEMTKLLLGGAIDKSKWELKTYQDDPVIERIKRGAPLVGGGDTLTVIPVKNPAQSEFPYFPLMKTARKITLADARPFVKKVLDITTANRGYGSSPIELAQAVAVTTMKNNGARSFVLLTYSDFISDYAALSPAQRSAKNAFVARVGLKFEVLGDLIYARDPNKEIQIARITFPQAQAPPPPPSPARLSLVSPLANSKIQRSRPARFVWAWAGTDSKVKYTLVVMKISGGRQRIAFTKQNEGRQNTSISSSKTLSPGHYVWYVIARSGGSENRSAERAFIVPGSAVWPWIFLLVVILVLVVVWFSVPVVQTWVTGRLYKKPR